MGAQGSMLGPMIGGALSYPCTIFPNFPLCENDALFQRRHAPLLVVILENRVPP